MTEGTQDSQGETALETALGTSRAEVSARSWTPPRRVGRYIIVDELGRGAMGRVYRAFDPSLDREVAVKVLHEDAEPSAVTRIVREARAMAQLSHPNVVPVYDAGTSGGRVFLAMELISGRTMRAWMDERQRGWAEIVEAFVPAGNGLAAAHAAKLVHRDFKPANVLMGEDDRVRVTDFGIVHGIVEEPLRHSQLDISTRESDDFTIDGDDGTVVGTPSYMAPEQHIGGNVDARSDQFAFCTALYEALAGKRPFRGRDVRRVAAAKFREIEALPRTVPAWLSRVVLRGLRPDPSQRWGSMDELIAALDRRPSRRRRRWLGASALVGTAAASFGWFHYDDARKHAECRDASQAAAEQWTQARRDAIRAAFDEVDAPYVARLRDDFDTRVDAWVEQWSQVRLETCVEQEVERREPVPGYPAMLDCMEDALVRLETALDLVGTGGRAIRDSALDLAAGLPSAEACREAAPDRVSPPPLGDEAREAYEGARRAVARVTALAAAGEYQLAHMEAERAYAEAEGGYPLLRLRLGSLLGDLQGRNGEAEEALATLQRTYWEAIELGEDGVAAAAANHLAWVLGVGLKRGEEARQWGRHAVSCFERLAEPDPVAHGKLMRTLAVVEELEGDLEAAHARLTDARAEVEAAVGEGHPLHMLILGTLADVQLELARYDESQAMFERVFALKANLVGEHHPYISTGYGKLGWVAFKKGEYDKAMDLMRKAEAIAVEAFGPDHMRLASINNDIGAVLLRQKDYDGALARFERSLAIKIAHLGPDAAPVGDTLNNVGVVHKLRGDLAGAKKAYLRSLEISETVSGVDSYESGRTMCNITRLLLRHGEFEEAARYSERCVAIVQAHLPAAHPSVRQALVEAADVLSHVEEQERALQILDGVPPPESPDEEWEVARQIQRADLLSRTGQTEEGAELAEAALRDHGEDEAMDDYHRGLLHAALARATTDRVRRKHLTQALAAFEAGEAAYPRAAAEAEMLREELQ